MNIYIAYRCIYMQMCNTSFNIIKLLIVLHDDHNLVFREFNNITVIFV